MKTNFSLYLMIVLAIILLAMHKWFFLIVVLVSFLLGILFSFIMQKIEFKQHHIFIVYVFLWLSIIGELGLYKEWEIYDKILHFIIPFFLAYLVNFYLSKYEMKYKKFIIFFIVLGMGAFFEVFEYLADTLLGLDMGGVANLSGEVLMDEWRDTIWDLIATMFGTIFFFIVNFFKYGKNKTFNNNNLA